MKYDKTGTGWGPATTSGLDSKACNCTDSFGFYFDGCDAEKIPARFQIEIFRFRPIALGRDSGVTMLAELYPDSTGWVPVDISEA